MQQEEFLEKFINEMKTASEDFDHDEKAIKSLVTSMIESKPQIKQDPNFKNKLANNLSRHIARKKNPVTTPAVSQSRLARFIAYGLPGLTLCFVIFYTLPFGGEDLSKTFETDTTLHIALPVETGSSDMVSSGDVFDSGTQELGDLPTATSDEIVNNQGTELSDIQDSTEEEMSEELMLLLGIIPASQNKSTQTNTQQETPSSQQNSSITGPEHIPVQTTTPASETSSSQQTVLMKGGETPMTIQDPTKTSVVPTATVQTTPVPTQEDLEDLVLEERKLFAEQLGKLLSVDITLRQGDIVDCLSEGGALTCDLLANRSFDKEHKSLLLDEIAKHLPSDLIDKMTMMQIRMILGL